MTDTLSAWRPSPIRLTKAVLHVAMYFIAFLLAYELRRALPLEWWFSHPDAARVVGWAGLFALVGGGVELVFRTERTAWRFTSLRETLSLLRSVTASVIIFLALVFFLDRGVQMPRSVLPLAGLLAFLLLVGQRAAWRLAFDPSLLGELARRRNGDARTPLIIIGEMAAADSHLRLLLADAESPYRPMALISPHAAEHGMRVQGISAYALERRRAALLAELTAPHAQGHALVFLDDPIRRFGFSADAIGRLRQAGHMLLRPQPLTGLDNAARAGDVLREIPLEAFLARAPVQLDVAPVQNLLGGKACLVTGAGGSIGSEICRQLLALGCSRLIMLDHSEFLLFEIKRELAGVRPDIPRSAVLASVRDQERIRALMQAEKPDIVFHAAALKHVVLVEENPEEGVLTNVLGTWNVLTAAAEAQAGQFVLISTDKAVAPSNVMGASKRVAESLLELAPAGRTRLSAVRFGNVLGSAGSVIPIFRDQIARGGPVTVTDPEVNRFFMTIPEAVQLVLQTTAISAARDSDAPARYLLEMGEPVKIVDLARQMIALSGQRPDHDVKIVFTGLKDGEKMAEALVDADEEASPCVEGVMEVRSRERAACLGENGADELVAALGRPDRAEAARTVLGLIRRMTVANKV